MANLHMAIRNPIRISIVVLVYYSIVTLGHRLAAVGDARNLGPSSDSGLVAPREKTKRSSTVAARTSSEEGEGRITYTGRARFFSFLFFS